MNHDGPPPPDWRPTASPAALRRRARLLADVRAFFTERGVLEVETPLASRHANTDPAIEPVALASAPGGWLRTSPEFALKRLLANGLGDCYELGRVFRSGESGRSHNPEFTMLEWYRLGWDSRMLAEEVIALLHHCDPARFDGWPVTYVPWAEAVTTATGVDPHTAGARVLHHAAEDAGLALAHPEHMSRGDWFDLLFAECVQPRLAPAGFTVIVDFPPEQAALARLREDDRGRVADRFEVFAGTVELANGYRELTDAGEQAQRFAADNARRRDNGQATLPADESLLAALGEGLPDCAGVALGIDRLLMLLCDAARIDEVIAFPADRA